MRIPPFRTWADDALTLAGVLCVGIGLSLVCPPWALWVYAGGTLVVFGYLVGRC